MGLSQTVTGLCSIHVDVQYALHPVTSWEAFCPDNLHIVSSPAAYGGCGHWGVCHGRCTQTVDPLEAKMGHEVDWCVQVYSFFPSYCFQSLCGKWRLEFLLPQTFLRPCSHLTLKCIWGDLNSLWIQVTVTHRMQDAHSTHHLWRYNRKWAKTKYCMSIMNIPLSTKDNKNTQIR